MSWGKRRARMRRAGMGALPLLAGLMMASGLIRLGDGTGQAIAREIGEIAAGGETLAAPSMAPDISAVLEELAAREARLDAREAALAERQAAMDEAETELRTQLAELRAAQTELEELLAVAEDAAEGDLTRLTAVYENMKPKEAAALFEAMAPQFAAGFLGRMRPEAAAKVMAGLTPETAYTISVMLAGRNAELPRQ